MRHFGTGATRDTEEGKMDYEGHFSPIVLKRVAEYLHKHNTQADGNQRTPDNWQKGMPKDSYIKSLFRHFVDVWLHHRGYSQEARHSIEDALCAIIFNAQGYLYELLKEEGDKGDRIMTASEAIKDARDREGCKKQRSISESRSWRRLR